MRTTVKCAADDLRYSARALKVALSHLLSAKNAHPFPPSMLPVLRDVARGWNAQLDELYLLAYQCDRADSKRRRQG